ncbi:MAG: hypothetical protein CBC33_005530 [Coraliomargarita sp. TMED73]|nr:MAG: hypothetical protein CBC33_005530 [Coraliomargarita sp. TMED73]
MGSSPTGPTILSNGGCMYWWVSHHGVPVRFAPGLVVALLLGTSPTGPTILLNGGCMYWLVSHHGVPVRFALLRARSCRRFAPRFESHRAHHSVEWWMHVLVGLSPRCSGSLRFASRRRHPKNSYSVDLRYSGKRV